MQKKSALAALGAAIGALMLSGCANDGTAYRADTYSVSQVNQMQEVRTVEIIAINPARVAVPNSDNRETARVAGALLGAIAGAAIGNHNNHSTSSRVLGGLAGGAVGGMAGDAIGGGNSTSYTDGVQLVYRTLDGRMYQSSQVAAPANSRRARPSLFSRGRMKPAFSRTTPTAARGNRALKTEPNRLRYIS